MIVYIHPHSPPYTLTPIQPSPLPTQMEVDEEIVDRRVLCQFKSETGASTGEPFDLPVNVTPDQLQALLNALLQDVSILYCVCVCVCCR